VPISVAAKSKAWVSGGSLAGIQGSNAVRGHGCLSCEWCVLSGTYLSSGQSAVQKSPTECGVSEYDLETSKRRRPGPLGLLRYKNGLYKFISSSL
jgi:hypothetical protein